MNALPVIPTPPYTYKAPVVVDEDWINPPTETPVPVNCKFAFSLTELVVVA